jgi:hypothetical protein
MGFLEDAIREHLELKRQQGADPAELAQKEFEALAPVVPEEPATWGHEPDPAVQGFAAEFDGPQMDAPPLDMPAEAVQDTSLEARAMEFSTVGQETAELDMREVFGFDASMDSSLYPEGLGDATPVRAARLSDRSASSPESLDWQVAAAQMAGESSVEIIPGQESLTFE